MHKLDFLKSFSPFIFLNEEALKYLSENIAEGKVSAGERIFTEGEPATYLYILCSGEVTITKRVNPEVEKILTVAKGMSIFGEMSIFSDQLRTASAIAKTDVVYYCISTAVFSKIFRIDPEGSLKVIRSLLFSTLERLEQTSRELATIYELSKIIAQHLTIRDFAKKVALQLLYGITNTEVVYFYLLNEFTNEYEHLAVVGFPEEKVTSITSQEDFVKYLSIQKETVLLRDKQQISKLTQKEFFLGECALLVPLYLQDRLKGFIVLLNKSNKEAFMATTCDLLNSISVLLTSVISNIEHSQEEIARKRLTQDKRIVM